MHSEGKNVGDMLALTWGALGTFAWWARLASILTPILSMIFVAISILWLCWRIFDRVKYGPSMGDDN